MSLLTEHFDYRSVVLPAVSKIVKQILRLRPLADKELNNNYFQFSISIYLGCLQKLGFKMNFVMASQRHGVIDLVDTTPSENRF